TEDGIDAILDESQGDLRRAINILQAAAAIAEVVDADTVYKALGMVTPTEVRDMIDAAIKGDLIKAREKLRSLMYSYALSGVDILKLIYREISSPKSALNLDSYSRAELLDLIGEINFRLVEGADDEIQLNAFLAKVALLSSKAKGKG
ncbi:MAG: replication factor C small subunit, partial [Thermoprotei archaeon]